MADCNRQPALLVLSPVMKLILLTGTRGAPLIHCLAALILCVSVLQAASAGQQARRAKQNLDKAEQKLRATRQASDKARTQMQQAEAEQHTTTNSLLKARQAAALRLAPKLGLATAAATREAVDDEVIRQRKAIFAALHARPDYQTATNRAQQASPRLRALEDDKSLTETERAAIRSDLSAAIRRPFEMEREELSRDARFQEGWRQLQAAEQKQMALQNELQKEIEADRAVVKAEAAAKKAANSLAKARKDEDRTQHEQTAAQVAVDRDIKLYEQALAQDRLNNARRRRRTKSTNPQHSPRVV